jgi:hypothetical protein
LKVNRFSQEYIASIFKVEQHAKQEKLCLLPVSYFTFSSTLKMEATYFSETSLYMFQLSM